MFQVVQFPIKTINNFRNLARTEITINIYFVSNYLIYYNKFVLIVKICNYIYLTKKKYCKFLNIHKTYCFISFKILYY